MGHYRYCPSDGKNVQTEHSWSAGPFIVLFLLGVLPGLLYLAVRWKRRCPLCHTPERALRPPMSEADLKAKQVQEYAVQAQMMNQAFQGDPRPPA
jgi:hypothetical protein